MSRCYSEQVQVQLGEPQFGVPIVAHLPGQHARNTVSRNTVSRNTVSTNPVSTNTVPTAFLWQGRLHVVREVLGHWTQRLPWWHGAWPADQAGCHDLEQEVWQVEASAGRVMGTGVYELTSHGPHEWHLVRVLD